MPPPVHLAAVATAVPPIVLGQDEASERARRIFGGLRDDVDRLLTVFDNAGIATRRSCVPFEWFEEPHNWPERTALFIDHAVPLLAEATAAALARAGLAANAIDAIVCVSTSGVATPSLEARLIERMPFRRDVIRLPIFGLGCAGGVLGLARAADLARALPGRRVLFLVVELCSLTFRPQDGSKSNLIAAALFGDGAAAAVLAPEGDGPALGAAGEHSWPNSLPVMGWRVEEDGFGVLFSRDIPQLVRAGFREATDVFLARHGLTRSDVDSFVCHPGGSKVLAALEEALELGDGALGAARDVLREFGNMSAATVMFVLERMLVDRPRRALLTALGPGFTAAFQLLEHGGA